MTKIAGKEIPVKEESDLITVHFSAGRAGSEEAGDYEFWSAVSGNRGCSARCRQGSEPGERFRIMKGVPGYEDCWAIASNAQYIRRATEDEVIGWLNGHKTDAEGISPGLKHGTETIYKLYHKPFATTTDLHYLTSEAAKVMVRFYDIQGRLVKEVYRGNVPAGEHHQPIEGKELSNGLYVCEIRIDGEIFRERLVVST